MTKGHPAKLEQQLLLRPILFIGSDVGVTVEVLLTSEFISEYL